MKKIFTVLGLVGTISLGVNAQGLCPFIGPDLFLPCGTNNTTLTADFSGCPGGGPGPLQTTTYTVANIPFAPNAPGGTALNMSDDSQAGPFNIGFSFCFFGNTYTQFYIGSNGWISFSGAQPTTFTSAPIPNAGGTIPKNCIMGPWQDWHPGSGVGPYIRYQTLGVAPCRKLVVSWTSVPMYSCTSTYGTFQIVIYESTNIIENHITNKPNCVAWAGGTAVQGIHNATGTVAFTVPGRNSTQWTTTNNAYRYTPAGPAVPGTPTWYQVGNPVAIGTGLTINVSPPSAGASYTCHMEYGACYQGYTQCMGLPPGASGPDTILVVPGPPNIYPTIPGPYDFCPDASITVGTDQPYTTYLWSDGGTGSTLTSNVPGPISVFVTDINGCTGTANAVLNMLPNPVINIAPVNPAICIGSSVQMTAGGATSYQWSPTGSLDNPLSAVVNANPVSTTTYTIIGTDANGCKDSIYNTVTVNPLPNVVANSANPGVCRTFSTQLTAAGALNYVWSPAGSLSNPNAAITTATPNNTQMYQVTGTDVNGCSNTATVNVLVYDLPVAAFSAPVTSGCVPVTINLQSNSNIASGNIVTYIWNVEGQGTSSATNPVYTFSTPGAYDAELIVVSDMGCKDTLSVVDYINAYSVPVAGFTATPQPANLMDNISFTNTSTLDAIYYNWNFGGLGTSALSDPDFQFVYADTFNVVLIVSTLYGCQDTVAHPIVVLDVSHLFIPNSFTPGNNDGLNDTWFPVGSGLASQYVKIDVQVFNRWGTEVYSSNSPSKPWDGNVAGSQSFCPQGEYVYKVYFKNQLGKEFNYYGHLTLLR